MSQLQTSEIMWASSATLFCAQVSNNPPYDNQLPCIRRVTPNIRINYNSWCNWLSNLGMSSI